MKYISIFFLLTFSIGMNAQGITTPKVSKAAKAVAEGPQINWMTWEEAQVANKKEPKKIFIDVYTDWCGWCKKMDQTTFVDAQVVEALNKDFYAVKFDAEQKNDIIFNDATFSYIKSGRRGSHQLAYALLDGRLSYPAFVLLDENFHRVMLNPGYQKTAQLLKQLAYTSTESYKDINFNAFRG